MDSSSSVESARKQPLLGGSQHHQPQQPQTERSGGASKCPRTVLLLRQRPNGWMTRSVSASSSASGNTSSRNAGNMISKALPTILALLFVFVLSLLLVEQKFTFQLHGRGVLRDTKSDDAAIRHNQELIRERPRNLRLIFLGDSVTRYQYLSLAYFLRHGRWFDHHVTDRNNLVSAHSFHHPMHPSEDWNEFFLQSNRMLYPMEVCDCLRSWDGSVLVERRYFYDKENNNMAIYINMNGNERNSGRGFYGRMNPTSIFTNDFDQLVGLPFGLHVEPMGINSTLSKSVQNWEYSSWGDVIRHHVGNLNLDYDAQANIALRRSQKPRFSAHVLLNAGLHPHDFTDPTAEDEIRYALRDIHLPGTWKTTTFSKEEVREYQATGRDPDLRLSDMQMCTVLGSCFDVSWTSDMHPELYYDNLHFSEPVYRIFNEEFLEQLSLLP